ncbi:MAG: methanogenesis marker 12 protein [Methanoregula sp.]|jgi:putative methanogenesis marker protein 12|uniref:methanogenesis marker 12 protein n=1 Tax=Methanoregula sp. TaxID=2052170 RepID=UPI0025E1C9EB|nr:methanogenesis marker 12 protein [Methanoregula sp.]MCK9631338.1 methanogenesis marker 12 protein [Methanoregula sp.]
MFIGIDHGTTAMRFAGEAREFKVSREAAKDFHIANLAKICPLDEIEGIAVCYSMGDNFSKITRIGKVQNRGLVSREGAGKHIGGGTRVFDEVAASGIPAIAIPGLHRGSPTDPRFKAYSHQTSPEKIGIAYEACHDLGDDVIVSDISSNTVTLLVSGGKLVGAFDACIFAPGTLHGALDVDAIRRIDNGDCTANDAFQHAGVNFSLPEPERLRTVALFAAMECAAMRVLNPRAPVALAGSLAPVIAQEVESLLGTTVAVYDEWCASRGCARIAKAVFSGRHEILGLDTDL